MKNKHLRRARLGVDFALELGAQKAESYISKSRELAIEVREGRVETIKLAEETGLGVRVMVDGHTGFAFTSENTRQAQDDAVRQALANARSTAEDPLRMLPGPVSAYPSMDIYDPDILTTPVEKKIELARLMEKEAKNFDPRVKVIESSSYYDGEVAITLVNSNGVEATYNGSFCGVYMALVAGEGQNSQTGFALDYRLKMAGLDAGKVGRDAARRAVRMLGAKPVPSGRVPVILDPLVATGLLGVLAPALTAEAVQKGRSVFAGQVDTKVASEVVTLVDDGTREGGVASAPFDGEGVPSSVTILIRDGILQGYLHNVYTAAKEGVQSTGNGIRGSFKSTPEVGATNFFIKPGEYTPEQLMEDIGSGFYVTEVMGMHTANPISGNFSVGASGIWIENGQLARPVRGVALAGNIKDVLNNIEGVGNDLNFFGGKGCPSLRIADMAVSGR